MLHACMTRLEAAATPDVTVVVSLDRARHPDCRKVVEGFAQRLPSVYLREMPPHKYHGNSYNILSGIQDCRSLGGDLIHVVEDDVLVAHGYFHYHEAMHQAAPDAFAVSACRNQNLTDAAVGAAAYLHPSYQSLGVSFGAGVVDLLASHARKDYYGDMVDYCHRTFPDSAIPRGHAEQDGLINRVREASGRATVYTSRPRAFHAGFQGYNRPGRSLSGGTIEDRSARILSMTSEEMNARAGEMKDHEVIPLNEELSTAPEEKALAGLTAAGVRHEREKGGGLSSAR